MCCSILSISLCWIEHYLYRDISAGRLVVRTARLYRCRPNFLCKLTNVVVWTSSLCVKSLFCTWRIHLWNFHLLKCSIIIAGNVAFIAIPIYGENGEPNKAPNAFSLVSLCFSLSSIIASQFLSQIVNNADAENSSDSLVGAPLLVMLLKYSIN